MSSSFHCIPVEIFFLALIFAASCFLQLLADFSHLSKPLGGDGLLLPEIALPGGKEGLGHQGGLSEGEA